MHLINCIECKGQKGKQKQDSSDCKLQV
jgi:hypothetical protein